LASRAVTVKPKADPSIACEGADTAKWVAVVDALTEMGPEVVVIVPSVAVIVWLPTLSKVTEKAPMPPDRVELEGTKAAVESVLLLKCTVPEYPVTVLLLLSWAVTVKFIGVPTVAAAGVAKEKWVAVGCVTVKVTPFEGPAAVVTFTGPVVAPEGTVQTMPVADHEEAVAEVPLKLTVDVPCDEPKFVPEIVT